MDLNRQEFLEVSFLDYYSKLIKKNTKQNNNIPKNLIKTYYLYMDHLPFNKIADNYRRKYILNENRLESVHNISEREGLRVVYDYVLSDEWKNFPNIYVILNIHNKLYSKVPHPEFGGKFRCANACIAESDVKTSDYNDISKHIAELYSTYDQLLKDAQEVINNKDKQEELLFSYIDRAIELKCRLIEIHPFPDGNGRSCRALLNILFRSIGLPPIYIRNAEKNEYIEAMDAAVRDKNYDYIKRFYYYKICDSIYDLDVSERKTKGVSLGETSKQYKEKITILKRLDNIFKNIDIPFSLDTAIIFLENDSKLNSLLKKVFADKLFRSDLKYVNNTLLYVLINLYADKHNHTILEDSNKYQESHISSALSIYYNDIQDFELLSNNKEVQLIKKYQTTHNNIIKDIIINSYQKLIVSICNLYANNQQELEEYIQDANLLLLSSINSYNSDNQYSFRTFVTYQIKTYFDSMLTNKKTNNRTNFVNRNIQKMYEIASENAINIMESILNDEEYSVALRMFGFLDDNHPLSNEHIAYQLDKDEEEIEEIRKKLLTKLSSEEVKNYFQSQQKRP